MAALSDFDIPELAELFARWGEKPSHAGRLLHRYYLSGGEVDMEPLRLSRTLRTRIEGEIPLRQSRIVRSVAGDDGTVKLLVGLSGGGAVESVLMPAHDGRRAAGCVSSQVGCAMGCDFCASTRNGLQRSLTAGEIVEQFLHLRRLAAQRGRRLSTLVFMGMGEPMHNLENVLCAVRRIASQEMGDLGWRQITISTVGIVPGMDALAEADLNVHLALSLHAADDATRSRIVPMNRKYGVDAILAAARRFQERTGRIVTLEYCLLQGINDSDAHAHGLADRMAGFRAHVNLIPYNSIGAGLSGVAYQAPPPERIAGFLRILCDRGVIAHARVPRGRDVDAACGQLRETSLAEGR